MENNDTQPLENKRIRRAFQKEVTNYEEYMKNNHLPLRCGAEEFHKMCRMTAVDRIKTIQTRQISSLSDIPTETKKDDNPKLSSTQGVISEKKEAIPERLNNAIPNLTKSQYEQGKKKLLDNYPYDQHLQSSLYKSLQRLHNQVRRNWFLNGRMKRIPGYTPRNATLGAYEKHQRGFTVREMDQRGSLSSDAERQLKNIIIDKPTVLCDGDIDCHHFNTFLSNYDHIHNLIRGVC